MDECYGNFVIVVANGRNSLPRIGDNQDCNCPKIGTFGNCHNCPQFLGAIIAIAPIAMTIGAIPQGNLGDFLSLKHFLNDPGGILTGPLRTA